MKHTYLALTLLTSCLSIPSIIFSEKMPECICQEECPCTHKDARCDETCTCIQRNGICLCKKHYEKNKNNANAVLAEIAYGELLDKITILEIKTKQIDDEEKLKNVWNELNVLNKAFETILQEFPEHIEAILVLKEQLYTINRQMWDIEDAIREKEAYKEFDEEFTKLARLVYITNDKRCRVKRELNILLNSPLIEEKSYKAY